ncbi:putative poly(rC)-binding protein 3 isoform X1 [Penaeus vannamei]|uniref:Putative poly(RC)-binding protein 3 isoform X1 n=1 Tax=Penaeus vannamei TaxID=6689 RepID=A0A3R7PYJ5_PENVA|nr:putative poly(rC)-binding protein 3 isoform X1 [Penaeus vannamei]
MSWRYVYLGGCSHERLASCGRKLLEEWANVHALPTPSSGAPTPLVFTTDSSLAPYPGSPGPALTTGNMATIENKSLSTEGPSASLSMRLLMQGKEVGSIIGKKGEIVKRFREESGAKINISDGSCPERIVTVTGNTDSIFTAFKLICAKFEEFLGQMYQNNGSAGGGGGQQRPPITLRLIVPASQCGSLIGKGGSKIKEIREVTGASIQVASEMLPNSTERAVTVSGTSEAITQCIYNICCVMLESPPKGATIPYRPKPQVAGGPVILAGGQAYTIQGNYAVPSAPDLVPPGVISLLFLCSFLGTRPSNVNFLLSSPPDAALAALAGSQLRTPLRTPAGSGPGSQTHEMTVPNELIGCIIGKGGTKIAEIRQITGAMITISKYDDGSEDASKQDRTITIKGNADQVALAQYLINTSMELHKAQLEVSKGGSTGSGGLSPSAIPLAQLLKNPQALNALSSLTACRACPPSPPCSPQTPPRAWPGAPLLSGRRASSSSTPDEPRGAPTYMGTQFSRVSAPPHPAAPRPPSPPAATGGGSGPPSHLSRNSPRHTRRPRPQRSPSPLAGRGEPCEVGAGAWRGLCVLVSDGHCH